MPRTPFRLLIVLMVLALVSLACLNVPQPTAAAQQVPSKPPPPVTLPPTVELPTPTATQPLPPTPLLLSVTYEGLNFSFDPLVASDATNTTLPAVKQDEGAPWEIQPETIRSELKGYALKESFTKPVILLYPVKDFQQISDQAAKVIEELRQVLATRPSVAPEQGLPFLPFWNAAQLLRTKIAYLDFANGSGVRYLTQYGQDAAPINNTYLFYTFQGLTADGKYYISAILPAANPILPPDNSIIPGGDYGKFTDNFAGYLKDIEFALNSQPDDSFQPHLTLLDNLVKSIKVNK